MFRIRARTLVRYIIAMVFLAAANPLGADETSLSLTPDEKAYLKAKGTLTIVCDPNWPPYECMRQNGRYEGISIDHHALLAERIGIPIQQIPTSSWSESLQLAIEGNCDLVSTLNKTPARERFLDFTDPFICSTIVIVGRTDCRASCIDDFSGRTFALVKGYIMEKDMSRDHPDIRHYIVNSPAECLQAVSESKADGTFATLIEAKHYIRVKKLNNLKIISKTEYENHHRIGVRKGEPLLLSVMQKAVRSLTPENREVIEKRWISKQENIFSTIPTFAIPLFVACLLLLVLAAWIAARHKKRRPRHKI